MLIGFFKCFFFFQLIHLTRQTIVSFDYTVSTGLNMSVIWSQVSPQYIRLQVTLTRLRETRSIFFSRENPTWQQFENLYSGKVFEMVIVGRTSQNYQREFLSHTIKLPPILPMFYEFAGWDGEVLSITVRKGKMEHIIDYFKVYCFSSPNTEINGREIRLPNVPYKSFFNLTISGLKHGANYTFAIHTEAGGLRSTAGLLTQIFTNISEPLKVEIIGLREDIPKAGVILTLAKKQKSVQSYFYILCKSVTDTDHACTKGKGVKFWDNRQTGNGFQTEFKVRINGLKPGNVYVFSSAAGSGSTISQYSESPEFKLSENPTNSTSRDVTLSSEIYSSDGQCDVTSTIPITTASQNKSAGESKSKIEVVIATHGHIIAACFFGGMAIGVIGSLIIICNYRKLCPKKKKNNEKDISNSKNLKINIYMQRRQTLDPSPRSHSRTHSSFTMNPSGVPSSPRGSKSQRLH